MRLLDPKLDIVFKLLFLRNPDLLRSQLEAVLGRRVRDFEVLNPEVPGEFPADKVIVLDLRVRMDSGERVDVEMQARADGCLADRFLLYATRDYACQLPRGGDYADLTPTVSVLWIGARMFPAERRFHLRFELLETSSLARYNDHLTLHVLQLPEISTTSGVAPKAERALHNWGRFFAATEDDELAELAKEDATMATAIEALEHLSQDPEAQRLAREREESVFLYKMGQAYSRREGRAEGLAEGRAEGLAEGRAEALKSTIRRLAASFGIEPTVQQLTLLDDPKADLNEIVDALISERRWP